MFGEKFVHGGVERSLPPMYIDPNELLVNPNYDPYKELTEEKNQEFKDLGSPSPDVKVDEMS